MTIAEIVAGVAAGTITQDMARSALDSLQAEAVQREREAVCRAFEVSGEVGECVKDIKDRIAETLDLLRVGLSLAGDPAAFLAGLLLVKLTEQDKESRAAERERSLTAVRSCGFDSGWDSARIVGFCDGLSLADEAIRSLK